MCGGARIAPVWNFDVDLLLFTSVFIFVITGVADKQTMISASYYFPIHHYHRLAKGSGAMKIQTTFAKRSGLWNIINTQN